MALLTEHAEQDTLGGGRFRQTIALKRIAYRLDGNLRRITNALGNSGDPALSVGLDELVQFRVADRLAGQSPVIHFGRGASNVRLTPLGTNNVNALVAGNVVTYPGAWDNADLRLSIGGHIVRKEILLRAGHPSSFAFRIANHAGLNIDTLSTPDFRILQPSLEGPNGEHIPLVWAISSSGGKYILTVTLPPGDYAGWVVDPTLVLQPDATDGKDCFLMSYDTALNGGASQRIYVGETASGAGVNHGLLQFSYDTVPSAALVSATSLALWSVFDRSLNARTMSVYRMLQAWLEGTGDETATGDGTTWTTYDGSGVWQTAGALGANDVEAVAIGSLVMPAGVNAGAVAAVQRDITLTPGAGGVQDWVSGATANNGIQLRMDTELNDLWGFASSDNATAANRPKLTIEYTLPAAGMSRAPIASWCH